MNTTDVRLVNFAQLSVTLDIAYKARGPGETPDVQAWVLEQLNSKPEFAEVKASNTVGWLGWPDFLDIPVPTDHPDHAAEAEMHTKVEHWLTLDREHLIRSLIGAEQAFRSKAYRKAWEEKQAAAKAKAMATEPSREEQLEKALAAMWNVASNLVQKSGMDGDDSMSDAEHLAWQQAAADTSVLLDAGGSLPLDPWHLFYIEAIGGDETTGDLVKLFLVSAQSDSETRAEEMARQAVDEHTSDGWYANHSSKVGLCSGDVFKELSGTSR